jgi:hypothetical protein
VTARAAALHFIMTFDELLTAALELEPATRRRLAERLLASLDASLSCENEQAWGEEAQRRAEQVAAGTLSSRPAEEVFRDAQSRPSRPR